MLNAKEKYNIDLTKSHFVGDTTIDIQTGINAGIKTILEKTGEKGQYAKYNVKSDFLLISRNKVHHRRRIIWIIEAELKNI